MAGGERHGAQARVDGVWPIAHTLANKRVLRTLFIITVTCSAARWYRFGSEFEDTCTCQRSLVILVVCHQVAVTRPHVWTVTVDCRQLQALENAKLEGSELRWHIYHCI